MSANGDRDPIDFLEEAQEDGPVEGAPEQDGPRTRQTRASPERRREIEQELEQVEEASQGPDFEPRTPSEDVGRRRIQATQAQPGPAEVQPVPADELSPLTLMTLEGDQVSRATRGATEVRRRAERGDIAAQVFDIGRQVGAAGAGVAEGVVSTLDRAPGPQTGVQFGPVVGSETAGPGQANFSETPVGVVTQEVVEDVPVAVGGAIQAPSAVAGTLGQAQEAPGETAGRVGQQAIQGGQTQVEFVARNPVAAGLLAGTAVGGTRTPDATRTPDTGTTGPGPRPETTGAEAGQSIPAGAQRIEAPSQPGIVERAVEASGLEEFIGAERGQLQGGRQRGQQRETVEIADVGRRFSPESAQREQVSARPEFEQQRGRPRRETARRTTDEPTQGGQARRRQAQEPQVQVGEPEFGVQERIGQFLDQATQTREVTAGVVEPSIRGQVATFDDTEPTDRLGQGPDIDVFTGTRGAQDVRAAQDARQAQVARLLVETDQQVDQRQEPETRQEPEPEPEPDPTPDFTPDPTPTPDRTPRPPVPDTPDSQAEEEEDPLARFLFGERQLEFELQGAEDLV
ncbi:MAG: hypothetical protein HQRvContig01_48 [Haloquadratum phage sp.]|nr:MAG: hypothetical protein HQRvContig01_48 [Haloquadratum phage sp.]